MYKLLVVEDDRDVRESIKEILEVNNFDVTIASGAIEGLELVRKNNYDLIISDIIMPQISGLEFLEDVRKIPSYMNTPFIFLTAQSEKANRRHGMNLGADDYISKPFKSSDLINSINLRLKKQHYFDDKIDLLLEGVTKYVPHELRTPLVAILGYPELIKENYASLDKEQVFDLLDNVIYGGKRMLNTLEKFMIYADLKSNHLKKENNLDEITENLNELVDDVVKQVTIDNDRFEDITVEIEEKSIKFISAYLSIVLKQLLENAIKFSSRGSKILMKGYANNEKYIFETIDQGIGMSSEEISKIGDFVQFNRKSNQQSGNGLGLAVVQNILEIYNTSLSISQNDNSGIKVVFKTEIGNESKKSKRNPLR